MTVLTIQIGDLGAELRRLPARDVHAVRQGIRRTVEIDAHRHIQWSIRGGGMGGAPSPTVKLPKKPKRPPKKRSLLRKVLGKLQTILGMKRKAKGKKPPKKKADPCERREPPAYRMPIDAGDYAGSWVGMMTEGGGVFYSAASPPVKAGVIELGRRAAPIPIGPLAEWVRRKLGCSDPKRALGIAIAISKKAAKVPRPGLHVLGRAHPRIAESLQKNVRRELMKVKPGT